MLLQAGAAVALHYGPKFLFSVEYPAVIVKTTIQFKGFFSVFFIFLLVFPVCFIHHENNLIFPHERACHYSCICRWIPLKHGGQINVQNSSVYSRCLDSLWWVETSCGRSWERQNMEHCLIRSARPGSSVHLSVCLCVCVPHTVSLWQRASTALLGPCATPPMRKSMWGVCRPAQEQRGLGRGATYSQRFLTGL